VSVVLIVILAMLVLLVGAVASHRNRAGEAALHENLAAIDRQLASAVAEDHGWERGALEATARAEFAERRPGAPIEQLDLVQIADEPGTDQDLAVFRVIAGGAASRLTLGRRDGAWYAAALEDER
jgi:hypothetical protein